VEVERPTRSARRRAGKSDRLDAYHAARAVLAERSSLVKDPAIGGLRPLQLARRSAVKARTAAGNQMKAILVMAPEPVRARFRRLDTEKLVAAVLRCRGFYADRIVANTIVALKVLAERTMTWADRSRRPAGQPRRASDRAEPNVPPPAHHRRRAPANRPQAYQERDPATTQTRDLPRGLPATHPALLGAPNGTTCDQPGKPKESP